MDKLHVEDALDEVTSEVRQRPPWPIRPPPIAVVCLGPRTPGVYLFRVKFTLTTREGKKKRSCD